MKLNKINCDFELLKIASEIDLLGGKIFIVGGTVRDSFLNLKSKDVDCEVFGLKEQIVFDLLEKYGTVKRAGVSFPILITGKYEISICEEKPLAINIFKQGKRRDFTINSIYYDIIEDKIIDNFNGDFRINDEYIWKELWQNFSTDYEKHLPIGDWYNNEEQMRVVHEDGFPKQYMIN